MPVIVVLALVWIAALLLFTGFGDWLTDFTATRQNLLARLKAPGEVPAYPLGTDRLGRDMVARLVLAVRMSLAIAVMGTVLGAIVGISLGLLAAHFRGWAEETIMAAVDFQASLPFILIALTLLAFFGNSLTLFVLLMALFGWERYARLARGIMLSATSQPYAQAVRALGAHPLRLYGRHILPNVAGALIVQVTYNFPQVILLETGLSFLGLGIQPPLTSLGLIMNDGRDYLLNGWWIAVLPGVLIFATTLAMSLVGDWLRDRLDPTLLGRGE